MQSKKLLTAVIAGVFISTSVLLAGCSKKDPAATPTPTDTATKIDADQTINIVGYDFSSLDPSAVSDAESFTTLNNVMEGLMREVLKDGKVQNVLSGAEKMDKSADGTVYTFTIRDMKWSDDKAVTANDFEYSWKRLCDPNISQDYLGFLAEIGVKGAQEVADGKASPDTLGVKAKDAKTLVVTLNQPTAYFESALSFKGLVPQRKDIVEKLGKEYGSDPSKMVYNGPFVVSEYAKGSKIVYTKNEKYWDANNVKLKTANGLIVTEPATIVKMFEGKELDMAGASGDDLTKLAKKAEAKEFQYVQGVDPSVFYYTFNTKSKVLSNAKVRLALSLSYDRELQISTVWKRNLPAWGIVPGKINLGDKAYRDSVPEPLKGLKDDPKALLSAGLKELGLPDDPSKIELKLLMGKASSTTTAQAQFIQNQWSKNLGIKITIQHAVDSPAYFDARTKGEFDICAGGWGADYNDVTSFYGLFMTGNGNNNGKYSNKAYDDLVNEANKTSDPAKRLDNYKKAEEILVKTDAAISPYYYRDVHSFRQNYLKDMVIPLFGGYFDLKAAYVQGK